MKRNSRPRSASPHGRWAGLPTEQRNPRSMRLDSMTTRSAVSLLLDEDRRAILAAKRVAPAIARAAEAFAAAYGSGHSVVFAGAGTSGRLGILEAAECPPTFGIDPRRVRAVMAGGRGAVFQAVEGAEDRADHGRREGSKLRRGDLLIAISASSVTPFARGALAGARRRKAATVLVTCSDVAGLRRLADIVIAIPTGPEVLTGSTRLKAGSATKAVLNAITTAGMVRLGAAYQNLMVDVRPTSAKLVDRSRRIVVSATGATSRQAKAALRQTERDVKAAIVVLLLAVSPADARARLRRAGGHIRRALSR